jgi:hypothetical protein
MVRKYRAWNTEGLVIEYEEVGCGAAGPPRGIIDLTFSRKP